MSEQAAHAALIASGVPFHVIRHGPVHSLGQAARARGVQPAAVVKTIVVRRGDGDFIFVLVPGDRKVSWSKLRALLGERRLSMPDAAVAKAVTGYERGTITPFGATTAWPVVADSRVQGDVTIGGGAHGVAFAVAAVDLISALGASVADVTDPESGPAD